MLQKISVFGELTKADQQDDGTLRIEGIASAEVVDSAGEIVLASAMKAAVPGFMNGGRGSLRLMHRADVAAGTVDSVEVDDATGETRITGTVVDESVVKSVRMKVLRGLSIGGKVLARDPKNPKVITKVDWRELSLVDRPACSASVLLVKAAALDPEPTEGGTDDMAPVQDLGQLTEEQVAAYLGSLPREEAARLMVQAVIRAKIGRVY